MKQCIKLVWSLFLPDSVIVFLGELESQALELNRATPGERRLNGCSPLKYFETRERALEEKADVRFRALQAIRAAAERLIRSLDAELEKRRSELEARERAGKVRAA